MKINVKSKPRSAAVADLEDAVTEFRAAKAALDGAKDSFEKAQHRLLTLLADRGEKSTTATINGTEYLVTAVSSERTKVDEAGLREAMTEGEFVALCDLKVSLKKVQEAINANRLPLDTFAKYAHVQETAPYVKVTETHAMAQ